MSADPARVQQIDERTGKKLEDLDEETGRMTDSELVFRLLPVVIVSAITPIKASALILLMRSAAPGY